MSDGAVQGSNRKGDAAILVSVLLIFGLVLGGFGLYRYRKGRESAAWPTVRGKVVYSHAEPHKVETGHHYRPAVKYTYTVSGKAYTGKAITASDEYQKTLGGANDILREYPVGSDVSVAYNPDDPGQAVLKTGLRKNTYVLLAGSVVCFAFAGAIVVSRLKKPTS